MLTRIVLAALLACLAPLPLPAQDSVVVPAVPAAPAAGAPVVVGRDTLFRVYAQLGPFTPAERAAAVKARLDRLVSDPLREPGEVRVIHGEATSDLVVGDLVVASITEADAAAAGTSRAELARNDARSLARAVRQRGWEERLRVIALGAAFALLTALATVVIFRLVNRVFPRIFELLERGRDGWVPALRLQKVELVSSTQLTAALLALARFVRVALLALLLYVTIPTILSFFPWTRPYAERLFGYILAPFALIWASLLSYVDDLFAIAAIVLVTWYLLKLIRLVFTGIARGRITVTGFYPDWAIPTYKIVRALVLVLAFIAIWPFIPGSDSDAFQGVGVFIGLLVSLGSAGAVGNMVGGVLLIYMRPFRVGDRVRISDTEGDVVEKSLLVTRIRTVKNVDITIPNSMVLGSHIVNYSSSAKRQGLVLNTTVTIGYDVPWRQVHELLIGAALDSPGVLDEPAPFVLQTSLDDFYVSYQLNAFTREPNRMAGIYSALHANIQDRFNAAGVEIMSPHYRAARDGNQTTIPADYLPGDYRVPAFRVESMPPEPPAA